MTITPSDTPRTHKYPRVTTEQCDEIKDYVNHRHLIEPRWFDISDCIGALQFDRLDLERDLAALREQIKAPVEVAGIVSFGEWYDKNRYLLDGKTLREADAVVWEAAQTALRPTLESLAAQLAERDAEVERLRDPNHPSNYEGSTLQALDNLVQELTLNEGDDDSFTALRRAWHTLVAEHAAMKNMAGENYAALKLAEAELAKLKGHANAMAYCCEALEMALTKAASIYADRVTLNISDFLPLTKAYVAYRAAYPKEIDA